MSDGRASARTQGTAPGLLTQRFFAGVRRSDKEAVLAAVQEGLDYYNRRDLAPLFDFFDPEIEWIPPALSLEHPQRGHTAVREMFDRWLEGWDELHVEVEDVVTAGDRVVVFVRQTGRGLSSGVEVENRVGFLWRIAAGKVIRFEIFPRPTEALKAAGIADSRSPDELRRPSDPRPFVAAHP